MDDPKEGYLLIGTTMLLLMVFLVAIFLLMLIYRRRKLEHLRELETMKEKYQKEMLETQIDIQRNTMQQIGREIHDNVGQKLTLAVLYAGHLTLSENSTMSTEKIASIAELINESLNDLRELSQYLTVSSEGSSGLDALLMKQVKKLNEAEVCAVSFESIGKPIEFSLKLNSMLLRITQEFLNNSIKHAECRNIYIRAIYGKTGFTLSLADDGKGFIAGVMKSNAGIGLENMKKRATLIGGELIFKSTPGKGTNLDLFLPTEKII